MLEEIKANGKRIPFNGKIEFDHHQNHIDFQFNAPVFGDAFKAKIFEYRFVNEDSIWQKTKNKNLIFSNLIPKSYELEN